MTIDECEAVADAGRVTAALEAAAFRVMRGRVRAALAALTTGVALVTAIPATAQDFFAARRDFVIEKSCEAYGSFKRRTNATPLVMGRTYPARGVNKSDAPSHAFIVIAGGGNKWVDLSCGRFADGGAPGSLSGASGADQHPRPASGASGADQHPRPVSGASGADQHPRPASGASGAETCQGQACLQQDHTRAVSEGATKTAPDALVPAPRQASMRDGHPEAQPAPDASVAKRGSATTWASGGANKKCLPFFDTVDNPVKVKVGGKVDISPPAPTLDAFDTALTQACGAPGKVVAASEFKALLDAHPEVTARIKTFTGSKVFADRPARPDTASYIDDLAEAWFAVKAFDHIMCGEPGAGRGKIGGMHFHARYLQLQNSGEACLMGNYGQNEVVPGVLYTTGVVMRLADGRVIRDARKGYGLTLGGEDLLKLVTRAFAENPTASSDSSGCLLPVADDGKSFTAVFVRRAAGIRTFYPDATPQPRDPKCSAAISLP